MSSEGVQRDLLPILEGSTVATKYGNVSTDHVLFIASGAFHSSKPGDMLAELQVTHGTAAAAWLCSTCSICVVLIACVVLSPTACFLVYVMLAASASVSGVGELLVLVKCATRLLKTGAPERSAQTRYCSSFAPSQRTAC